MKRILTLIIANVLICVFCACNKPEGIIVSPKINSWVFVKTIPEEETILLAKSGPDIGEAFDILDGFEAEYGESNVWLSMNFPGGIFNYEIDTLGIKPDTTPNCYEHTMVIEFSVSTVPSVRSLLEEGFLGVRISGVTAICKDYFWAYTEEGAEYSANLQKTLHGNDMAEYWGGVIINNTYENLGPEVHNEPIIF